MEETLELERGHIEKQIRYLDSTLSYLMTRGGEITKDEMSEIYKRTVNVMNDLRAIERDPRLEIREKSLLMIEMSKATQIIHMLTGNSDAADITHKMINVGSEVFSNVNRK